MHWWNLPGVSHQASRVPGHLCSWCASPAFAHRVSSPGKAAHVQGPLPGRPGATAPRAVSGSRRVPCKQAGRGNSGARKPRPCRRPAPVGRSPACLRFAPLSPSRGGAENPAVSAARGFCRSEGLRQAPPPPPLLRGRAREPALWPPHMRTRPGELSPPSLKEFLRLLRWKGDQADIGTSSKENVTHRLIY